MPALTTSPWDKAVARLSDKTIVGSKLRSAEWAQVPLALRERAFFSAGVENARVLGAMRDKVQQGLQQVRTEGTLMNKARFVSDMRALLGAAPGDSGDLADITSRRRLELIWDFQQTDAHAQAAHVAGMDPDVQDAYPALRLVRIESRRVPREWFVRWGEAGASVGWVGASKTEMVALRTSPIWAALSRFGRPWPPFDFGSGMGLEDVDRDETEQLGLLPKGEAPADRARRLRESAAAAARNWNEGLQASVRNVSPEARAWLQNAFGDQIHIGRSNATWRSAGAPAVEPEPETPAPTDAVALPDIERVTTAVAKAQTREEAHAIVALPPAARGSLALNPTEPAMPQTTVANAFLSTVVHKDIAPKASAKVQLHIGRSYYDPNTATVFVRSGENAITVHELAHHIECSTPEIYAQCRAFLQSRAKPGEQPQRLSTLTGNRSYHPSEIAIEDEWAARGGHVYTGKVYPEAMRATEILSVGLERLYREPARFARDDPQFFKFILGVLRPKP